MTKIKIINIFLFFVRIIQYVCNQIDVLKKLMFIILWGFKNELLQLGMNNNESK